MRLTRWWTCLPWARLSKVVWRFPFFKHVMGRRQDRSGDGTNRFFFRAGRWLAFLRAAAQAHCTKVVSSQGAPPLSRGQGLRIRVERRLPWAFRPPA